MNKLFLFFILLTTNILAQIPAGINPSSISQDDLDKYGLTQEDVNNMMMQNQQTAPAPAPSKVVEVERKAVVKDDAVVAVAPTIVNPDNIVYGRNFFSAGNLSIYESATHIKASPNYVLGSGDEISVSIWGYSEHSGVYSIGSDGAISPKLVGKIYLKGQTFEKAKSLLSAKFGKVYDLANSQISIELNYSKAIRVNIVGEVNTPGTYTVPAINPVFNILSLAGGISESGSIRNIQIRREGKIVNELDVYQFLKDPLYKSDFFLMDNDYIVVGMATKIVSLNGGVVRPSKYELKENEGIKELISFSGGFLPSAYTKLINLYRYQNDRDEIIEINYEKLLSSKQNFTLKNGDRLTIPNVPEEIRNRISVQGAVNIPSSYVLKPGMTVKNLLELAGGLTIDAFTQKAYLSRKNDDYSVTRLEINLANELSGKTSTVLKEFDDLNVFSKERFRDKYTVEVNGAVRNPGTFDFSEGLTLADALFLAGGVLPQAAIKKIEIARISDFDNATLDPAKVIVENIEIDGDLLSEKSKQFKLKPLDKINVRFVPNYDAQQVVSIEGEVLFPGAYTISNKGETISQIIERSGGLTNWAFLEGAYLRRKFENEKEEFIVFDLKKLMDQKASEFDYILRPGDRIVIPTKTNFINLSGEVKYPKVREYGVIKLPYERGHRAKFYIKKYAAGFSQDAKRSKTYVETPGGYVKRTKNILGIKIYPKVKNGDQIFVLKKEEKREKNKKNTEPLNWNKAIESATVKIMGFATLYLTFKIAGLIE